MGKQRPWQMSPKQYEIHRERKWQRNLRAMGLSSSRPWDNQYKRTSKYWKRLDKVRDPKSAFLYLLDNVAGCNGGKLLRDRHARGQYYWEERNRDRDQAYYVVKRKGNHMVVTRTRWVVDGQGVNTFLSGLIGSEQEPKEVREVILRHPIMDVENFRAAYAAVAPDLDWY